MSIPSLTILSEEQKFNGENLLQWNTNITQLLSSKGLLGYVNGSIKKPPPSSMTEATTATDTTKTTTATASVPTPIYSSTPTHDEWLFRDQLARGHITLNCTDVMSLGIVTEGTAREAWTLIQEEWGKSTDMHHSHAQEALNQTLYVEGTDIQDHIKLLHTRKAAIDNLSTSKMTDETWKGILIWSIPPTSKWLPVIPSLCSMSSPADIVLTLFAHGIILGRDPANKTSTLLNTALAAHTHSHEGSRKWCTNPLCKAKKQSTHNTEDCYWPGGGKEGQFPPNFGQRSKANVASSVSTPAATTSPPKKVKHFALSAQITDIPGISGIILMDDNPTTPHNNPHMALISKGFQNFENGKTPTFLDSGASDMMFVSKDDFSKYKSVPVRAGDSAKAGNGGFEIIGEGNVRKRYKVEGKERDVTYTRALHTPTLNANLISVSALDKAGLTITFGKGKGVVYKA